VGRSDSIDCILGADVIFVAVAQRPLSVLGNPYYLRSLGGQLGSLRAALAKAIAFTRERRVSFETELMVGPPAKKILELARSRDVGLIVVGSRGHDAAEGTPLGSVSSSIVHHADRPVLVTRTGDRAPRGWLSRMAV
jgi:nucleotide-binding universal stress UspA family protein